MGFFDKLKKGLSKTREMMSDGINRVFASMGRPNTSVLYIIMLSSQKS